MRTYLRRGLSSRRASWTVSADRDESLRLCLLHRSQDVVRSDSELGLPFEWVFRAEGAQDGVLDGNGLLYGRPVSDIAHRNL
jgi:hypothetical protein